MLSLDDKVDAAAHTLTRGMADEPLGRWLLPDPDQFRSVYRELYAALIRLALEEGRVDTWGDPVVGVAVWLVRPAVFGPGAPSAAVSTKRQLPDVFPTHAWDRVERHTALIRQLREQARPDRHAYLDSMAVLPEHRRRGIASRMLAAGHAWADATGLPCALDTETAQNVAFYGRRGYRVVAELALPGSDLSITAMRRALQVRSRRC